MLLSVQLNGHGLAASLLKKRRGMKETRKEAKKSVYANTGQVVPKHILVADDNKAIRDAVSELLEFIGYEVALAINGIEALAVFLKSAFDLVLTDFEMPTPQQLIEIMRQSFKNSPL